MDIVTPSALGRAERIDLVAVGDVMLGRGVTDSLTRQGIGILGETAGLLTGDVVTGNLECSLTERRVFNRYSHACFSVPPAIAEPILRKFDVFALANNHVFDYLDGGITDTLDSLAQLGIGHAGVGVSPRAAREPAILERKGWSIAVFSAATTVNPPQGRTSYFVATLDAEFFDQVTSAARMHDLVIVHLHAGGGDYPFPAPDVRRLHDRILAAGAQVVIGHHPHLVQGWRATERTVDAFSMGDFLFDSLESGRNEALVLAVQASADLVTARAHLVQRAEDLSLQRVPSAEMANTLTRLESLCAAVRDGSSDDRYLSAAGKDYVKVMRSALVKDVAMGGWRSLFGRVRRLTPGKLFRNLNLIIRALRARQSTGGGS